LSPPTDSRKTPKTHCRWKHEYTPQNTRIRRDGKRVCRQCERDRARRRDTERRKTPEYKARMREYQREWVATRRTEWLADKSCAVCGSRDGLEIDHIDPATKDPKLKGKKRGAGSLWSWSDERRSAELAKCQVLCHTHHKMKTHGWESPELPHGRQRYEHGCRCATCRYWRYGRYRLGKDRGRCRGTVPN
jgi:hypothetical protein